MATTFTWSVVQLDCYPEANGNQEVVFNVHWTLTGEEAGFTASAYGSQGLTLNPAHPFTPFADLTHDQVVGWVKGSLGGDAVAAIEDRVSQQINEQVAPSVVHPPLPWAASA